MAHPYHGWKAELSKVLWIQFGPSTSSRPWWLHYLYSMKSKVPCKQSFPTVRSHLLPAFLCYRLSAGSVLWHHGRLQCRERRTGTEFQGRRRKGSVGCILFKLSEVPCIFWKRPYVQEGNTVPKAPKKKSPGMMGGVSPFSSSRWEPVSQELSMWSHEHDHVIDKQRRKGYRFGGS